MKRKGFHLPFWPRTKIVSIDKIISGAARGRRARLIVRGGLRRRLEIRNGDDAVLISRQFAEFVYQLRIDGFRDYFVSIDQILSPVEIEARIVAQKFRELMEAALKSG